MADASGALAGAGAHVIVNTPTGSGKSLIALGAHVAALARHNVAVDVVLCDSSQGMPQGRGDIDVPVMDIPLTGDNALVHSPARLADALSSLLV